MVDFESLFSGREESLVKYSSFEMIRLIPLMRETVGGGQFKWGACLLKGNGGV